MARYKVLQRLIHDNHVYEIGDEIDLNQSELSAQQLTERKIIQYLPPSQSSGEPITPKPVEKFHAPTTEAEITKAVAKQVSEPEPEAFCQKCKAKRRLTDYVLTKTSKGQIAIKGTCPICGVKIFRLQAGAVRATSKRKTPKRKKI